MGKPSPLEEMLTDFLVDVFVLNMVTVWGCVLTEQQSSKYQLFAITFVWDHKTFCCG